MTRILILYGTTDGQTEKIARFLAAELSVRGAIVDVCDAEQEDPHPEDYTGVLVAASIHAGGYQRAVVRWARAHAEALRPRRNAFISVCLGALQNDLHAREALRRIKQHFIGKTGWTPTQFKVVAGAVRYTRYGWLKRLVMRRIVRKAGGETDTTRDYEYTDWHALQLFAARFFTLCSPTPPLRWDNHTVPAHACVTATIPG
jgi:menaquinone-dependent protoporphyrinogen oxidase